MEGDMHRPNEEGEPVPEPPQAAQEECEVIPIPEDADPIPEINEDDSQEELAQALPSNLDRPDVTTDVPPSRPRIGGFLTPSATGEPPVIEPVEPVVTATKTHEMIEKFDGNGLSAYFRFNRTLFLPLSHMVNISVTFVNHTCEAIRNIRVGERHLAEDMHMSEFNRIVRLPPNGTVPTGMGIDFNDTIQEAEFQVMTSIGSYDCVITPTAGELMRPVIMKIEIFIEKQGRLLGDREHVGHMVYAEDAIYRVPECANLGVVDTTDIDYLKFAGRTLKNADLVLVTLRNKESVAVQCENEVFGAILLHEIMQYLQTPLA